MTALPGGPSLLQTLHGPAAPREGSGRAEGDPHPIVAAAAQGDLPPWAEAGPERRRHMARVASLLDLWAGDLGVDEPRRVAWRAAGRLHDALRDARPSELARRFPKLRRLPGRARHGPAAAATLRRDGVRDRELLHAIRWHTLGSRNFGPLGAALYAADFVEPGRAERRRWRAKLRARMPGDAGEVLTEIAAYRIHYLLRMERPVHPRTVRFWNSLVSG